MFKFLTTITILSLTTQAKAFDPEKYKIDYQACLMIHGHSKAAENAAEGATGGAVLGGLLSWSLGGRVSTGAMLGGAVGGATSFSDDKQEARVNKCMKDKGY